MPFGDITLVPGVNTERTATLNQAGYSESNNIRWKDGLVQKLGGWEFYYPFLLDGIPRAMHAWQDLNEVGRLAVGTTTALNLIANGSLSSITPQQLTTNGAIFETTSASPTVRITDAEISALTNLDRVFFDTPVSVGGLILASGWFAATPLGVSTYSIEARNFSSGAAINASATLTDSSSTVTITSASPAVVSWAAHGLTAGRMVKFTSSGTVPTGMVSGQTYYVSATGLNPNDFQIEDLNGRLINTSSTGTGTITATAFYGMVPNFQTDVTTAGSIVASATVTITIASPGVVTWANHNLTEGQPVYFTTSGALPTGLTASTTYYVSADGLTSGTFRLAASYADAIAGLSSINTSGTQSGVQTGYALGSSNLVVNFEDHNLIAGDTIVFPIPTTIGVAPFTTTVSGTYTASSILDPDSFTIALSAVTSCPLKVGMNGDKAQVRYDLTPGVIAPGSGYGVGGYGEGGYGTGSIFDVQTGDPITATDYSFDNWGPILLANPENGSVYYWDPSGGNETAQVIVTAPPYVGGIFVAMPAQILVTWGSSSIQNIGIEQDPLLVKWSDQLDFNNWIVSTTSQAGSFRIPTGSRIVGALQGPQSALIVTDLDAWVMQYVGYPLVFGFNKVGASCGLISSKAVCQLGGMVYWMGKSNFYALTGKGGEPIPCTVWDKVFQDLDLDNAHKVRAWPNTVFNEVWWFYPSLSGGTGENDKWVKINVTEGAWDYGSFGRSAAIDQSVLGNPITATLTGAIYEHELGQNDGTAPLMASFTTGYARVGDGENFVFIDQIIPDMRFGLLGQSQDADLQITFYVQDYPSDTPEVHGPYSFNSTTTRIEPRMRGRQVAIKVESSDLDSFWRLGKISYRYAIDGRR